MTTSEIRQVSFHLLSGYDGLDREDSYSYPRRGASIITVEMSTRETLRDGAVRALRSTSTPTTNWLLQQLEADAAYITALAHDAPLTNWRQDKDEEYLLYSLDYDGSLRIHLWLDSRWITLGEVEEVVAAGYVHAKPDHFVIHGPEGRGGDNGIWDVASWLYEQGVDIGVSLTRDSLILWVLAKTTGRLRNGRADRRARRVAQGWRHRSIESPWQLRQFLDRKHSWTVDGVDTRLFKKTNATASKALLRALGYEPNAGEVWQLGTSRRARRGRARWLQAEDYELGSE